MLSSGVGTAVVTFAATETTTNPFVGVGASVGLAGLLYLALQWIFKAKTEFSTDAKKDVLEHLEKIESEVSRAKRDIGRNGWLTMSAAYQNVWKLSEQLVAALTKLRESGDKKDLEITRLCRTLEENKQALVQVHNAIREKTGYQDTKQG